MYVSQIIINYYIQNYIIKTYYVERKKLSYILNKYVMWWTQCLRFMLYTAHMGQVYIIYHFKITMCRFLSNDQRTVME